MASNTANTSGFEDFCGGTFWDFDQTWNNPNGPEFTLCFQITALVWVPCGFLWLLLIPYAHYLSQIESQILPGSTLNRLKMLIATLLFLTAATDTVKGGIDYQNGDRPMAYVVSPTIACITLLLSLVLIRVERMKAFVTSGVLFLFHLLLVLTGIVPFYMKILEPETQGWQYDKFRFVTFYMYYCFLIVQFILLCFAEKVPTESPFPGRKPCPEVQSSFLSRLTFWWINGLVLLGYKKTLEDNDLWASNPRDLTKNIHPDFDKAWMKELASAQCGLKQAGLKRQMTQKYSRQVSRASRRIQSEASERTPLLQERNSSERNTLITDSGDCEVTIQGPKKKSASLLKTLAKVYGFTLFRANLCKLVCDGLTFVGPILQSALINYTETDMPRWKGYFFASLFFLQALIYSFFFHQLFHIAMTLGMRIKAALIAAVYKKALTMSNEARKTSTVGEIVNLMSVDAQRMQDVTAYLYLLWSAPLQIIIAMYMLWGILGPSIFAGVGVMVLLVPINGVVANIQNKLQLAQMTQKDQRIKLMNEILNGIKVLKLYAWELSFKDKINVIRNLELETLKKNAYLAAFGTFTWTCAPFMVTLATFVAYILSGNNLDAQKAFVSLSLFTILSFPINVLPMMIAYLVTASVSIKRLSKFLQNPDIDMDSVQHNHLATSPLTIERGTFSWGTETDDAPTLKNINLQVPDGQLVAVVGQVGCGKSSLISAFLGEMEKLSGHVNVRGSIAYVAQQAWIQNLTLRDNILFGKEYHSATYNEVLEACALKPDLEILPAGDQTEIGEKGINLSGGQKQRVSLARAVYNDADIYLLDDPLSAVDSHVGKHIFEKVVGPKGLLSGKTRVMVTHGVQWLPNVDKIVVLVNGEISEVGSYEELLSHDGPFAQFLKTYLTQEDSESEEECDEEVKAEKRKILERVASIVSDDQVVKKSPSRGSDSGSETKKRRRKISSMHSADTPKHKLQRQKTQIEEEVKKVEKDRLIEEEKREEGRVKLSVFVKYVKALGPAYVLAWVLFYLLYEVCSVVSNIWLSRWTTDPILSNDTLVNTSKFEHTRDMYLGVYGGLGGSQAFFVLLFAVVCAKSMVRASRNLHESMLYNILRSPMSFFDTTPIGRIINRFSRDIETIDNVLPSLITQWIGNFCQVLSIVVVISYSTPIFLSVILPIGILYYFVQRFYIRTSRQLKRIESTTRSPIYIHFSETVTGASTIRAYDVQQRFKAISENKVDNNLTYYFAGLASNRWLGFRLEFVGALFVFSAALFAVIGKENHIEGGIVGLSITYALQVTQSLNWLVRVSSDLETNVVSVERIQEYTETEQEAEWYISRTKPHDSWPDEGKVVLNEYSTRYRPGLDLVLRGVNVKVNASEKVGIVGRTGAGKSSLTLSLFRLIEAAEGRILIDGIPLETLGLHQLRSRITILPQDPVLFSGSMRMNLDPFDKYTDNQIWNALENAHLKDFVANLASGLDYECGEGGQNLSVGQRQLVCLARTLLRKTKILVLDEATAAVDLETDDLIQNTIRQEFKECTILTIAHRLNTIMDNDRILVLDAGMVAEYDSPTNLLQRHDSIFYGMAKDAGLV